MLDLNSIPNPQLTCPLVTVSVSLKVLTVALVKSHFGVCLLCLRHTLPSLSSFMTALLESFSPMVILDIISLLISTFLLFSQIGKPVLETPSLSKGPFQFSSYPSHHSHSHALP